MTNEEKLREVFPKTIFIQRKEEDKTAALMVSDEWLESEYIDPDHEEVKIINNMRRNNPFDMTIKEQIEKVKEDCCNEILQQYPVIRQLVECEKGKARDSWERIPARGLSHANGLPIVCKFKRIMENEPSDWLLGKTDI